MRIAICDDERTFCHELEQMIYSYYGVSSINVVVDIFSSGELFLKKTTNYDLLFLDYQMEGLNGLQTAYEIRRRDCDCNIVFVTSFASVAVDAYEVNTFRFLTKPVKPWKFKRIMDDFMRLLSSKVYVTVTCDGRVNSIPAARIVSLEAKDKGTVVTLSDRFFQTTESLHTMESKLPSDMFFKTHRSYIVNLLHIKEFTRTELIMDNGQKAKISRLKANEFNIQYLNCMDKYSF